MSHHSVKSRSVPVVSQALERRLLFSGAPLTTTTQSVTYSGFSATVKYSVFDPVRNITASSSTTYSATAAPSWSIGSLTSTDGIVTWTSSRLDNSIGVPNSQAPETTGIGYAVYDPIAGGWKAGTQAITEAQNAPTYPFYDVGSKAGIVVGNGGTKYSSTLVYGTYDPSIGSWSFGNVSKTWTDALTRWSVGITANAGSIATWAATQYYTLNQETSDGIGYAAYSASAHTWITGSEAYVDNFPTSYHFAGPDVSSGTVTYSYSIYNGSSLESTVSHSKGFNGNWYEGTSKGYAYFDASPVTGPPPLNVWYWDESVGTASWLWNFGDGATGTAVSGYHTYTSLGSYSLKSTVTDAGGSSSYSTPISVSQINTTTTVASSVTSPTVGQSVKFTATVVPASGTSVTGTVQFQIDGNNVGNPVALSSNTASYTTSTVPSGTHTITAAYSGNANFLGSSGAKNVTVVDISGVASGSGAAYTLTGSAGAQTLELIAGSITFTTDLSTAHPNYALQIDDGATVVLASSQHIGQLVLDTTATLDISVYSIYLAYQGTSPLQMSVLPWLIFGFNGGDWRGNRLTSSAAAAVPGTTIGYADNGSQIHLKYTYYGDASLDGRVDGSDYAAIDYGYLTHASAWKSGDFNYDGVVDGSDYTLIDNAFNTQGASLASQIATPSVGITVVAAKSTNTFSSQPISAQSDSRLDAIDNWKNKRARKHDPATDLF